MRARYFVLSPVSVKVSKTRKTSTTCTFDFSHRSMQCNWLRIRLQYFARAPDLELPVVLSITAEAISSTGILAAT